MGEARSGPPAWTPAGVGAAPRHGTATEADLLSGSSWQHLVAALDRAGRLVTAAPTSDVTVGFRQVLILLALGIDEALRHADPYDPHIRPGNVDNVLKWGMDCPDAFYSGMPVRGDATYRITGNRGTARYLGFQVMGGMETLANVVADDLDIASDGSFEWTLSPTAKASSLVVRQFFYDWDSERPADLHVECTGGRQPQAYDDRPAAMARRVVALGEFVEASLAFWKDIEEAGRAQALNQFRTPANRTDMGGAEENVTTWGSYELADGEALLIEVTPPKALYWSVAIGDPWWASVDYANHQSSLNGHQAHIDDDGAFRAVLCARDPGIANWLDPAGFTRGPMIFRWLRADNAPVPDTRVLPYDDVATALPHAKRVTPEQRADTIARRRAAVRRRFCR
jgi:hypothetical protein